MDYSALVKALEAADVAEEACEILFVKQNRLMKELEQVEEEIDSQKLVVKERNARLCRLMAVHNLKAFAYGERVAVLNRTKVVVANTFKILGEISHG